MWSDFYDLILRHFFVTTLAMSMAAAVAALAVMALRLLLKRLNAPRLAVFLLWAVVLFRMVCPVSFESPASLLGAVPQSLDRGVSQALDTYTGDVRMIWDTPAQRDAYRAGSDFSALTDPPETAEVGSMVEVAHPSDGATSETVAFYSLTSGALLHQSTSVEKERGGGSGWGSSSGSRLQKEDVGPIGILLTYAYPDGSVKNHCAKLLCVDPAAEETSK